MAEKKKWDLTSAHSLQGACEWIRKRGGAQVVLAIRKEDWAIAFDIKMGPLEVRDAVREMLAPMLDELLKAKGKG
jgi:hypothetical protein